MALSHALVAVALLCVLLFGFVGQVSAESPVVRRRLRSLRGTGDGTVVASTDLPAVTLASQPDSFGSAWTAESALPLRRTLLGKKNKKKSPVDGDGDRMKTSGERVGRAKDTKNDSDRKREGARKDDKAKARFEKKEKLKGVEKKKDEKKLKTETKQQKDAVKKHNAKAIPHARPDKTIKAPVKKPKSWKTTVG